MRLLCRFIASPVIEEESITISIYLSIHPFIYLSIYLYIYLFFLSIYLYIYPSIYISIHLSQLNSPRTGTQGAVISRPGVLPVDVLEAEASVVVLADTVVAAQVGAQRPHSAEADQQLQHNQ